MEESKRTPDWNTAVRIAMFGPKTRDGGMGPSFINGSVSVYTGPCSNHWTQTGGGDSQCGTTAPPNTEYVGWASAAFRSSVSQSERGKMSSSVNTARSPSTKPSPVFSAEFFP